MVVLSPVVFPLLALADVVTGAARRLPLVRIGAMALAFAFHEWYAIGLYLKAQLGTPDHRIDRMQLAMGSWSTSLLRWAGYTLGARFDWGPLHSMPKGRLVVLSRHASNIDAIIPAMLFPRQLGRPAHYVLKRELRWVASIDLFAPPLGSYFVSRGRNTERELRRLEMLASIMAPDSALIIFPEGTFSTPANRARIRASLVRKNETAAIKLADELVALLPPKPAGAIAVLNARPDATVMILAHRGLDGVASFAGLRANVPLANPVTVRWWKAAKVPPESTPPNLAQAETSGVTPREQWLQDEWRRIDRWVSSDSTEAL